MVKLPAGLQRVAAYAAIAALVTGALFAADSAYRWYDASRARMAAPSTHERAAKVLNPAPADLAATAAPAQLPESPTKSEMLQAETKTADRPSETPSVAAQVPNPAGGLPPAPATLPASDPVIATPATGSAAAAATPSARAGSQPPLPPSRPEPRTQTAREAMPERTAPRRPVQAAEQPVRSQNRAQKKLGEQPNVYWERDDGSQLGFAPQLRKKTCDPATGQMPMQCYYPREGRERFPAKPLN